MLNGIDPIILIHLKKVIPGTEGLLTNIPIVSEVANLIEFPVIPIYLSEKLTGIYIDSESKSILIDTTVDTKSDGSDPGNLQKGLENSVRVDLVALNNSIGLLLLSAFFDTIFPKVTSKEYAITYMHGPITVFQGLLRSFNISQDSNENRCRVSIELIKQGTSIVETKPIQQVSTSVPRITGASPL